MPNFCLMPEAVNRFKKGFTDGTIDPYKLNKLTSEERRAVFKKIIGDEDAAKEVNANFESKMLLKDQKRAYVNWAKQVAGLKPEVRRDLIARIERIDHILSPAEEQPFLEDLAAKRLGVGVTQDEAKNISNLSSKVTAAEANARPDGTFSNKTDAAAYGESKVNLENYVNDLKIAARKDARNTIGKKVVHAIKGTPGFLKSSISTLDNSFYGRQGISVLFNPRTSDIWVRDWLKSWGDIAKSLRGRDALDVVKADIYSRPNALNGKYRAGNYGLEALSEEAYPSSAPEKIPLLGRLFKASESAYNGGALRMRADLADRFIKIAEKQGINTLDRQQARGIGTLVGEMTGRGSLNSQNSITNSLLFSPKFLKANFDGLTLHAFDKNATAFTRKEAAKNLAGIVGTTAAALALANKFHPGSVEFDPRSTHFGKIKIGQNWVDITGGKGAILTLAARLASGKTKTSSGNINEIYTNKYGAQNAFDVTTDFFAGKFAPAPAIFRDIAKQDTYQGTKPTVKGEIAGSTVPLSIQNYNQMNDQSNASRLAGLIADGLGFSVTQPNNNNAKNKQNLPGASKDVTDTLNKASYTFPELSTSERGKELSGEQYKQFVDKTNRAFIDAVNKARNDPTFQHYTLVQQKSSLSNSLTRAKNKALDSLHVNKPKKAAKVKSY